MILNAPESTKSVFSAKLFSVTWAALFNYTKIWKIFFSALHQKRNYNWTVKKVWMHGEENFRGFNLN